MLLILETRRLSDSKSINSSSFITEEIIILSLGFSVADFSVVAIVVVDIVEVVVEVVLEVVLEDVVKVINDFVVVIRGRVAC